MKRLFGIGLAILLLVPAVAGAQILVAGEGPVVYGHHHLNTTNMDAQKKFFVDTLGGALVKFGSGDRQWMINLRVRDLDAMVEQLRAGKIDVSVDPETYPNGRFARLHDPEGNPIELWEPR